MSIQDKLKEAFGYQKESERPERADTGSAKADYYLQNFAYNAGILAEREELELKSPRDSMRSYLEMAKKVAIEDGIETLQKVFDHSRKVLKFYGLPEE